MPRGRGHAINQAGPRGDKTTEAVTCHTHTGASCAARACSKGRHTHMADKRKRARCGHMSSRTATRMLLVAVCAGVGHVSRLRRNWSNMTNQAENRSKESQQRHNNTSHAQNVAWMPLQGMHAAQCSVCCSLLTPAAVRLLLLRGCWHTLLQHVSHLLCTSDRLSARCCFAADTPAACLAGCFVVLQKVRLLVQLRQLLSC